MIEQFIDDSCVPQEPVLESHRRVYESPKLVVLQQLDIATGMNNVPEASDGVMS